MINWKKMDKKPIEGSRIIVFSPVYVDDLEMRIRIMDEPALRFCSDAKFWAYIDEPEIDCVD